LCRVSLGLRDSVIMRTNAGKRWFQIETARGTFSPTFGNLFLPDSGWVDTAKKNHTDLIYTFNTVPKWATREPGDGPALSAPYDIDARDEPCVAPPCQRNQRIGRLHLERVGDGSHAKRLWSLIAPHTSADWPMCHPIFRDVE